MEGDENGLSERLMGFSKAAQEVLVIAHDCNSSRFRSDHGVCGGICHRTIHLLAVLVLDSTGPK